MVDKNLTMMMKTQMHCRELTMQVEKIIGQSQQPWTSLHVLDLYGLPERYYVSSMKPYSN